MEIEFWNAERVQPKSVTSIDVGTVNMFYWIGRYDESLKDTGLPVQFIDWNKINLHAATPKTACQSLVEEFLARPHLYHVKDVVTESQNQSVDLMQRVESGITAHFETVARLIKMQSSCSERVNAPIKEIKKRKTPGVGGGMPFQFHLSTGDCKLRVYNGPEIIVKAKSQYSRRKKLAIEHTRALLKNRPDLKKWLDWFESLPKKDDAADCFLQGVFFLVKKYQEKKRKTAAVKRAKKVAVDYDGEFLRFSSSSSEDEKPKTTTSEECSIIEISDDEVSTDIKSAYNKIHPQEDDSFC